VILRRAFETDKSFVYGGPQFVPKLTLFETLAAMCCSSAKRACSDFKRSSFAARVRRSYASFDDVPICCRSSITVSENLVVASSNSVVKRTFSSHLISRSRCRPGRHIVRRENHHAVIIVTHEQVPAGGIVI